MAIRKPNYLAYAAETVIDTTAEAAAILGISTANAAVNATNGSLALDADSPPGFSDGSLRGDSQTLSGTGYLSEVHTATAVESFEILFWMPSGRAAASGGSQLGMGPLFIGVGSTRVFALSILSTDQYRLFNAAGGTLFTSTISGGFADETWYCIRGHITVNGSSSTVVAEAYPVASGPGATLTGSTFSSSVAALGSSNPTHTRHGIRTGTSTADSGMLVRVRYDTAAAYLMDPEDPAESLTSTPADPVGVTDTVTVVRNMVVNISDGVGVIDTGSQQTIGFGLLLPDAVGVSDVVVVTATLPRTAAGGVTIAGTAAVVVQVTRTASGGPSLGGTASQAVTSALTAAGGVVLSGSAAVAVQVVAVAAGGVTIVGLGDPVGTSVLRLASGGVVLGSSVPTAVLVGATAGGGVVLAGSATAVSQVTRTASGGVSVAGSSAGVAQVSRSAASGPVLDGYAEATAATGQAASGGVVLGGSATFTEAYTMFADGVLQILGFADAEFRAVDVAGGLLELGGEAEVSWGEVVLPDEPIAWYGGLVGSNERGGLLPFGPG